MARYHLVLTAALTLAGCAPRNIPPDQAQVTLSNTRIERKNGEDVFSVDYKFTRGRPDRGRMYRLNLVSGVLVGSVSGEVLLVDRASGTILWRAQVAGPIEEPPLVRDRQVVVVAGRGNIHSYR